LAYQDWPNHLKNGLKMEDRYAETFDTWNKVAALYQDKLMNLTLYDHTYDFICEALPFAKAKLLEIGCGPGNITRYLLSKRPDFEIFGIDVAPTMIELAQSNNPTARFAVGDCRRIAELNTKFDGVIAGFCLPYLAPADGEKFIRDCGHLLNDNGLLYLSFVEGDPGQSGFQTGSSGDRAYFYFYNLADLIEQLRKNNFENLKVVKVEYPKSENELTTHTILTAAKKPVG
jgi:SAM-dependent methyltransferase